MEKGEKLDNKLFVVIGNKTDGNQNVPMSEVEKFCDDCLYKPLTFMTSCKTRQGKIEDVFTAIAKECVRRNLGTDSKHVRKRTLDMQSEHPGIENGEKSGGCGCNLL